MKDCSRVLYHMCYSGTISWISLKTYTVAQLHPWSFSIPMVLWLQYCTTNLQGVVLNMAHSCVCGICCLREREREGGKQLNHKNILILDIGLVQFRNCLFKKNGIGIDKFPTKQFNPQNNLPLKFLIQKYFSMTMLLEYNTQSRYSKQVPGVPTHASTREYLLMVKSSR